MGDAVRRVVAIQAQEPASPYLALWNRIDGFDPADLDAAFAERGVVKASLLRLTLHAVVAEDYPAFHDAMAASLRASRLADRRFTTSGLSVADADGLLPHLLEFVRRPRAKAEIETFVGERLGASNPWAWWALRTFAPLHHAPTGGPWSFGPKPAFVAADTTHPGGDAPVASVRHLVRRYLEGFGPASAVDVAQFTLLRRGVIREALTALGDELEELDGPGGTKLFDVRGGLRPDEATPAPPRLLPMWDSILLAYADRSRVIPPDVRRTVIRVNGDVLPTLLVDGCVAGVWRPVEGGIEVSAFQRLAPETWRALEVEAAGLVAFLAPRDPTVYRRYGRWWAKVPSAEVRVLAG